MLYEVITKANVERHVNIVYQRIYALIRNEVFYSLTALNNRILELLDDLNQRIMQGKGWSRYEHFVDQEKPLLGALPANFFNYRYRREFTVSSTYHVLINEDKHYYSVPYQYFGKKVTVVYDYSTVEIYHGLNRIATHARSYLQIGYSTLDRITSYNVCYTKLLRSRHTATK